jgi:hypothetical protein
LPAQKQAKGAKKMSMNTNQKDINKLPDGTSLVSAGGIIRLAGRSAFGFEPKAREKSKQYLNVLISMAAANGYGSGAALLNHFRSHSPDRKKEDKFIHELLSFISANEITSAFEYISQG